MNYNEKLRELRINHNMSQEQLAEKLHVTRQTVSKWEQGINEPDIFTFKQYAAIFNVTLDELVGDVEKSNKSVCKVRKACKTLLIVSTMFYIFCVFTVFILWRFLQNEIAAHYNIWGEVDRYGSKHEVLLHLLSFTVFYAITLMTYFIGKKNIGTPLLNLENTTFIVMFSIVVTIPVGYLAFVLGTTVQYLIEEGIESFIMCIAGAVVLVISIASHPKITPANTIVGYRTVFTLTNPEAWKKVNTFTSICISVAMTLAIVTNMIFISYWAILGSTILLFVTLPITVVYHEVLRKKIKK